MFTYLNTSGGTISIQNVSVLPGTSVNLSSPVFEDGLQLTAVSSLATTVDEENVFTDPILIKSEGLLRIVNTSSGVMTITLQSSIDGGDSWLDEDSLVAEGSYLFNGGNLAWRAGCKTGDYTSGAFTIELRSN